MITTCTSCGSAYEAGSEEQAYEPIRYCFSCRKYMNAITGANQKDTQRLVDGLRKGWNLREDK
jgi:hypothetical protein